MFKVNDVVVYGSQGVFEIVGIDEQKIDGEIRTYFVLKPKVDRGVTCYVPMWNEKALAKIRKVMSKQDIDALIDSMPSRSPTWIANDKDRKEAYKNIISSRDQSAIITMVQALFYHKKKREAEGKRLHMSDEHFLEEAEQLLFSEWQYVLNVDKSGLISYIFERIEKIK